MSFRSDSKGEATRNDLLAGNDLESLGRKRSSFPKGFSVNSMLVLHQGALGDFILALPSLEILRNFFPRARSVFMGYPRILELVEKRFYADEILSIDRKGMASFFVRGGTLDPQLCEFFGTFDLIVVFGKDAEGSLSSNMKRACRGRILQINLFPRWDERIHLADHLVREFSRQGFPDSDGIPKVFLNDSDRVWARQYWTEQGVSPEERARTILLHPGSGSKKKVWPVGQFARLAEYLQKHLRSKVLIILGPAEGPEVKRIFESADLQSPLWARSLSLVQLASIMEGCRLFLGNDSGISHLAAALSIPTVAVFGPTDPKVWSPRGEKIAVVRREIPCSPCTQERFFQCQHFECLKAVDLSDVLDGIKSIGAEKRSQERR